MAQHSADTYGEFGSVPFQPSVAPTGATNAKMTEQANPADFGAAIGQGLEKFGNTAEEVAQHYGEMAVHTAVNDQFVNGYVPQVSQIESDFKKLQGTEAVQQQPIYEQKLRDLNNQYINSGSLMQQQLMGDAVRTRSLYTMNNIANHADQQFTQHQQIVTDQSIKQAGDDAMNNWQTPDQVDFNVKRAIGVSNLDYTRKLGYDDQSQGIAAQMSKEAGSKVAAGAIDMAIDNRDFQTANAYKNKYGDLLSGQQKLEIEKKLSYVNIGNNASNISDNLLTGKPLIPQGTQHYQDMQSKANIADLAQKNNFDPNIAFGLVSAESDYGRGITDKSIRKDAFQTDPKLRDQGFQDDSLESSIHNGAKIWNENSADLTTRLGRAPSLTENYLAYNQGGQGANALLSAAPTDTAIGALSKIMPADEAQKHILANGGNPTMSAADFVKNREDWFQTHYDAQKASNPSPDTIRAQTQVQLPAIQQSSNPHELFNQMNDRFPAAQAAADTIADDKLRDATQKQLKLKYEQAKLADNAWKNQQAQVVQQISDNPRYTSMDQIPESVKSNLRAAGQLGAMEKIFNDKNVPRKDNSYGDIAFLRTMTRLASSDPTDAITDQAGLQQEYADNPNLHSSGFKQLQNMLKSSDTPQGKAVIASQANFLSDLREKMVAGESDITGKQNFEKALPLFFSNYNNAAAEKKNISDLMSFDLKNKNSFVSQLNLPSSVEMTDKKIQNTSSWLSSVFGKKETALTPAEQVMADFQDHKISAGEKDNKLRALGVGAAQPIPQEE